MANGSPMRLVRLALVWAVLALATVPIWRVGYSGIADLRQSATLEDLLAGVCGALLLAGWAWLLLTAAAAAPDMVRGVADLSHGIGPRAWLRLLALLCGVALTTGLSTAANAGSPQQPPGYSLSQTLTGLPVPDRVGGQPTGSVVGAISTVAPVRSRFPTVVVQPGDTLWHLASRQLGREASNADIAASWPRWHDQNRAVIGQNPHLIQPGMSLRVPTAEREDDHR